MERKQQAFSLKMFKERIKRIYFFRHTLWDMAISQLKSKYAGSRLGIWWAVATPLIFALSINFVFTKVFKINTPNYTFFVLSGIIPWFFFSDALGEATNSFIFNSSILKQGTFPREFIPLSSVLANLFKFLIGMIFLFPVFIILNFKVIKVLPFLCLIVIFHFLFIVGLSLLFSFLNILFRDLSHFLSIGFMIWFWITPIFYSLDMLPFPFRWICLLNPMTYFVILYQDILFRADVPLLSIVSIAFLISITCLSLGYFIFIKQEPALLKKI